MFSFGEPVEFLRATPKYDPYSRAMTGESWDAPEVALTVTAGVEPKVDSDATTATHGNSVVRRGFEYRLYLQGRHEIDPLWRVRVRGRVLAISSTPQEWHHPMTGWEPGTVVEVTERHG